MRINKLVLNWLIVAYCLLIILLSVVSLSSNNSFSNNHWAGVRVDYVIHAVFFLPWMTLASFQWNPFNRSHKYWVILGIGFILASVSEFVQLLVPNKTFNPFDMVANGFGVCVGAIVSLLFAAELQKRQER